MIIVWNCFTILVSGPTCAVVNIPSRPKKWFTNIRSARRFGKTIGQPNTIMVVHNHVHNIVSDFDIDAALKKPKRNQNKCIAREQPSDLVLLVWAKCLQS